MEIDAGDRHLFGTNGTAILAWLFSPGPGHKSGQMSSMSPDFFFRRDRYRPWARLAWLGPRDGRRRRVGDRGLEALRIDHLIRLKRAAAE
jgi:hypothetical protein